MCIRLVEHRVYEYSIIYLRLRTILLFAYIFKSIVFFNDFVLTKRISACNFRFSRSSSEPLSFVIIQIVCSAIEIVYIWLIGQDNSLIFLSFNTPARQIEAAISHASTSPRTEPKLIDTIIRQIKGLEEDNQSTSLAAT